MWGGLDGEATGFGLLYRSLYLFQVGVGVVEAEHGEGGRVEVAETLTPKKGCAVIGVVRPAIEEGVTHPAALGEARLHIGNGRQRVVPPAAKGRRVENDAARQHRAERRRFVRCVRNVRQQIAERPTRRAASVHRHKGHVRVGHVGDDAAHPVYHLIGQGVQVGHAQMTGKVGQRACAAIYSREIKHRPKPFVPTPFLRCAVGGKGGAVDQRSRYGALGRRFRFGRFRLLYDVAQLIEMIGGVR